MLLDMNQTIRITAFIGEDLAKKFVERTRQIGVSGAALLSRTLPGELNYLAEIPSNSERAETAWRLMETLATDTHTDSRKVRRLNITLDRQHAEHMSQLCREKRIKRDIFIGSYIAFLVNGPLKKISEILANPRHEYEEKRRNGPKEDETFRDENGDFLVIKAVSQENPYRYLHIDEDQLDFQLNLLERIAKNRTPENR
jgi:hypothetical protein